MPNIFHGYSCRSLYELAPAMLIALRSPLYKGEKVKLNSFYITWGL